MNLIYKAMEAALPFSWAQYDFMKNAFLAILFITPLLAIVGTMIVQNKMSYFSDALGHSALTGIAIGVVLGIANSTISMIIFAVIFALLLNKIKCRQGNAADTIISVFSSASIALGLIVLSRQGNFSNYSAVLVGDILSITKEELFSLFFVFVVTLFLWCILYNKLLSISLNAGLAKSRGIRVKLMENVFVVIVAVIVMLSIKWVGILLINALLVLPVAAAKNIASNVREYQWFSVVFSLFSGICGFLVSYYLNAAAGPVIVLVAALLFLATYIYSAFLT